MGFRGSRVQIPPSRSVFSDDPWYGFWYGFGRLCGQTRPDAATPRMSRPIDHFRSEDVVRRALQFDFSLSLFRRNHDELRLFLACLAAPRNGYSMLGVENRWLVHEAMLEVTCLLHNFVAAAKSLVDHSRVVYRDLYEPRGAIPEYQAEVDRRFKHDPLSKFIAGLREMSQHQRLPNVTTEFHFENQAPGGGTAFETRLQLKVADLLRYSGWTTPARHYLESADKTIDIAAVTRDYWDHVVAFYDWFRQQQRAVHGDAADEYARSAMHGLYDTNAKVFGEIFANVVKLEQRDSSTPLKYTDLSDALAPALTIVDGRALHLCMHDPHHWIDVALAAISRRFTVPDELAPRLRALIR